MLRFSRYAVDEIADSITDRDPETVLREVDPKDLPLLVHLATFHKKVGLVLRHHLIAQKKDYDAEGEQYKTPFALRDFQDKNLRDWIFRNVKSFATVHGCTGGCVGWCGAGALITSYGQTESIPLEQKKHFFDELMRRTPEDLKHQIMRKGIDSSDAFYMYSDNDPFDDPDIIELMDYLYETYGGVPVLSTVIPPKNHPGHNAFKRLAADSAIYRHINYLKYLINPTNRLAMVEFDSFEEYHEANTESYKKQLEENLEALEGLIPKLRGNEEVILSGEILERINFLCRYLKQDPYEEGAELSLDKSIELSFKVLRKSIRQMPELSDLEAECANLEDSVKGRADIGTMRVSHTLHRDSIVKELHENPRYHFYVADRHPDRSLRRTGLDFFDSGEERAEFGINCISGVNISPFGVFNVVGGRVTHSYPKGQIEVPFKGLNTVKELSKMGDPLASILEHVILIKSPHNQRRSPYQEIFVYDGLQRVRHIFFNNVTYQVESDTVVQENVESMDDLNVKYPEPYDARMRAKEITIFFDGGLIENPDLQKEFLLNGYTSQLVYSDELEFIKKAVEEGIKVNIVLPEGFDPSCLTSMGLDACKVVGKPEDKEGNLVFITRQDQLDQIGDNASSASIYRYLNCPMATDYVYRGENVPSNADVKTDYTIVPDESGGWEIFIRTVD